MLLVEIELRQRELQRARPLGAALVLREREPGLECLARARRIPERRERLAVQLMADRGEHRCRRRELRRALLTPIACRRQLRLRLRERRLREIHVRHRRRVGARLLGRLGNLGVGIFEVTVENAHVRAGRLRDRRVHRVLVLRGRGEGDCDRHQSRCEEPHRSRSYQQSSASAPPK